MKKNLNCIAQIFASGLGLGLLPKAPGTFGSLWGPILFFALHSFGQKIWWIWAPAVVLASIIIADRAETAWQKKDDQRIVIDEVAGMWVTYCFVSFSFNSLLLGFIFFRLFDVLKLFPARLAQDKLKGGIGVVADDVVAGLQAGVLLWLVQLWTLT